MQRNILWSGIEYHSLENCIVAVTDAGTEVNSTIVGTYNNIIYKVAYQIRTNQNWETISCELSARLDDTILNLDFKSDGKGNWSENGKPTEKYSGCTDVDIPLTPFTNTLPIRRLELPEKEEQIIKVLYLDVLEQQIRSVQQKYTRLSQNEYKYENVPNDFEAVIRVDEDGLVVMYPGLFKRTIIK